MTVNVSNGDNEPPTVDIVKPENSIYIFNRKILPNAFPLIIGEITIQAHANDEQSGIAKVEFYIDNILKHTDIESPYEWLWDENAVGKHEIKAIAYDTAGNTADAEQEVWIFNI
ncbi:MAG: Ig-like domain-containing protein [Candidatus Thermoplasmatota archaeon]|nr:Ig-like domain-containing protein [Candidatus Thermoplasmatota archaeon]